jgi:hypothetical protein
MHAQAFRQEIAPMVFAHPKWATDIPVALGECIARIEQQLLADPAVDMDFSGRWVRNFLRSFT